MAEQPEKSKKHRPGRSHRSRRANPWNILRRYILMGCLAGVVLECAYFHPLTCAVTPLLCAVFLVVLGLEGLSTGKHRRRHKRLPSYPPRRVLSVIVWVGLGLVVLQIIPLPRGVLSLVSPRAVEFRAESGVFPERFWSTVSLCPFRSRLALLKWGAAIIGFSSICYVLSRGDRIRIARALVLLPLPLLVIGTALHFGSADSVYSQASSVSVPRPFGPWLGAQDFAILTALLLPSVYCRFLYRVEQYSVSGTAGPWSLSRFLKVSPMGAFPLIVILFLAWVCPPEVLLALGLALLCTGVAAWLYSRSTRTRVAMFVALTPAVVICMVAYASGPVAAKAQRLAAEHAPLATGGAQWRVFKDFPIAGAGAGAFASVYTSYTDQAKTIIGVAKPTTNISWLACEMGLAGLLFGAALVVALAYCVVTGLAKTRSSNVRWLLIGLSASTGVFLVHGLTAYNCDAPAPVFLFGVLAGYVAVGRKRLGFRWSTLSTARRRALGVALVAAGFLVSAFVTVSYRAEVLLSRTRSRRGRTEPGARSEGLLRSALASSLGNPVIALETGKYFSALAQQPTAGPAESQEAADFARQALRTAIRNAPAHPEAYYRLGLMELALSHEPQVAETLLKRASALGPNQAKYRLALGDLYERYGNKKEALACYRKSLEESELLLPIIMKRGLGLCSDLAEWRRLIPEELRQDGQLARVLAENDQLEMAREEVIRLCEELDSSGKAPTTRFLEVMGAILPAEEVSQRLGKWREQFSANLVLISHYCRSLIDTGKLDEALETLDESLKRVPARSRWIILHQKAEVLEKRGDLQGAEALLIEAARDNPLNPTCAAELGSYYRRNGQSTKALETLLTAVADGHRSEEVLCTLADVFIDLGDLPKAMEYLQKARLAAPDGNRVRQVSARLDAAIALQRQKHMNGVPPERE